MQTSLFTTTQSNNATPDSVTGGTSSPSDLFTKLLVAQIKNQDPLSPTDPSQFVSQLTQLSQMESLQKLASQNSANASMLQSMQAIALGAQVGSKVTVSSNNVVLADQAVNGGFTLQNTNAQVSLVLTGTDGREHNIALGTHAPGDVSFTIDPVALGLLQGNYSMRVDTDSKESPAIGVSGVISNVKLSSSGSVALNVANVGEVLPTSITQFNGR